MVRGAGSLGQRAWGKGLGESMEINPHPYACGIVLPFRNKFGTGSPSKKWEGEELIYNVVTPNP